MTRSALLIVDMLSGYDFPDSEALLDDAPGVVDRIAGLRRSIGEGTTVVFANDIDRRFSGSREEIYREALGGPHPRLVEPLEPAGEDCFLHKGQHSAFYGTPLAHLLHEREIERIVLTGQVTEQCILYTALDAHVRHHGIDVLTDCVLSIDPALGAAALRMMETNMGARLLTSDRWAEG